MVHTKGLFKFHSRTCILIKRYITNVVMCTIPTSSSFPVKALLSFLVLSVMKTMLTKNFVKFRDRGDNLSLVNRVSSNVKVKNVFQHGDMSLICVKACKETFFVIYVHCNVQCSKLLLYKSLVMSCQFL